MDKVVFASSNVGKIRELTELLKDKHIQIIPQSDLGVNDIEETGLTFVENALIKARHAATLTGLPAIADDSGLAVSALHGAPGIYSARYAGRKATSADNINKLLAELEKHPDDQRQACFHCVLVYLASANDPTPLICDGIWQGTILKSPQGNHGFGYDPVFYVPEYQQTAAELSAEIKNSISHRGKALACLLKQWQHKS